MENSFRFNIKHIALINKTSDGFVASCPDLNIATPPEPTEKLARISLNIRCDIKVLNNYINSLITTDKEG